MEAIAVASLRSIAEDSDDDTALYFFAEQNAQLHSK